MNVPVIHALRGDRVPGGQVARRAAIWTAGAGALYVSAWVVGLLLAPSALAATATAAEVHAHYAQDGPRVVVTALLVHGVAGVALATLAVGIPLATNADRTRRIAVATSGLAAAGASLLQFSLAILATHDVPATAAATSLALFQGINITDTVKLCLLAVFVAAATTAARRAGVAPGWMAATAAALAVLLPLGGAALLADAPALTAALYASLPLLLIWVGATSAVVARRLSTVPS